MCKEIIYWISEILNYYFLIFFGYKLFSSIYEIKIFKNNICDDFLWMFLSVPIALFAAGNIEYVPYSTTLTYIMILYMYITFKFIAKNKVRKSLLIMAIYIFSMRLIDLWIVTVVNEANKISRHIYIELIQMGLERTIFMIFLCVFYYSIYKIYQKSFFIDYFIEHKFYRKIVCLYCLIGNLSFSTVYRFDYTDCLIGYWTFYLVCAFVFIGGFLFYIVKIKNEQKEKFLNMRNDLLETNYHSLQKIYDINKTLQHDYKNHILAVSEYIKDDKKEEALEYIYRYIEYTNDAFDKIKSGNDIVDIIVSSKENEAKEKNIKFVLKIDCLNEIYIEDIDMCALLANMLDNAIEACEKVEKNKSWINLIIQRKNDMLFIELKNSISQSMIKKKNFFKSDKTNLQLHGWGMKSIEHVVHKYGGVKEYYLDENYIELFITIPI